MNQWFFDQNKLSAYKTLVDRFRTNQRGMGFNTALYNDPQKGICVTIGMPANYVAYTKKLQGMAINIIQLTISWLQSYGMSVRVTEPETRQKLYAWIGENLINLINVVLNNGHDELCSILDEQIDALQAESVLSTVTFHDGLFWKKDGRYYENGCWISPGGDRVIEQNMKIVNAINANISAMS